MLIFYLGFLPSWGKWATMFLIFILFNLVWGCISQGTLCFATVKTHPKFKWLKHHSSIYCSCYMLISHQSHGDSVTDLSPSGTSPVTRETGTHQRMCYILKTFFLEVTEIIAAHISFSSTKLNGQGSPWRFGQWQPRVCRWGMMTQRLAYSSRDPHWPHFW